MKKFVVFILWSVITFGQHSKEFQPPKTPEVYLFEKYGNVPISSYTGRPNISIPLHTIQHGDINIALSLSYTSNGIRVDEESSSVGLGWYFSTGMISQTIQDKDDLKPNRVRKLPQYLWASSIGYPILPNPHWDSESGNYYNHNYSNNSTVRVVRSVSTPTLDKYFITRLRSEGNYGNGSDIYYNTNMTDFSAALGLPYSNDDLTMDHFSANFFGHNLIFIIDGTQIRVLNNKGYKIEKTNNVINAALIQYKWKITTPDGIAYFFDEEKITEYDGSSNGAYSSTNYTNDGTGYKTYIPEGPSNYTNNKSRIWKITKIQDTKGNQVLFNYESLNTIRSLSGRSGECNFINVEYKGYQSRNVGPFSGSYLSSNYYGPTIYPQIGAAPLMLELGQHIKLDNSAGQVLKQQKSILKEILYSDTKVEFNNTDRIDIPFDKKISGINVYYKSELRKTINFNHDYFNSSHAQNTQKRLKLVSVSIDNQSYSFNYNDTNLPNKDSNSFDYWGFYNGMPNTSSINNPFRLYQNTSSIPAWAKQFIALLDNKANRSAHPIFCKAGILEKITYPTGGITEFVYELNEFDNYFFPNYDNKVGFDSTNNFAVDYVQSNSKGYGLRIKETIDYANNNVLYKKRYSYRGGKHIPAYVGYNDIDRFKAVENRPQYYSGMYQQYYCEGAKITAYHSSIYQSGILGNGDNVGYDSVSIEQLNAFSQTNGKIVEYFTNIPDVNGRQKFSAGGVIGPFGGLSASFCDSFGQSIRNSNLDNGLLFKKEIYDKNNVLKQKLDYGYSTEIYTSSSKYDVKAITLPGTYGFIDGITQDHILIPTEIFFREFLFLYFPIIFSKSILNNEKVTEYFPSGSKLTTTEYQYNVNNIPTGKKVKNQSGQYFYEESSSMASTPDLITKNILNLPSTSSIAENGSTKKYYQHLYTTINNVVLPSKIEEFPEGNSDPSKKINVFYDLYDDKSNLIQYHKENDIYTCIIWGYNKTLPVAKIENVQYTTITAGLITDVQDKSNTGTEAQLLTALENLRNSLPNAFITTYTHKPLIGVSTITDSKRDKITYHYDSNNRLQFVKDKNGNILSENEYHFRP